MVTAVLVCVVLGAVAWPRTAQAHGPVAPLASSYLARVAAAPRGLEAEVVDGDQRMWLRVPPATTVVVLDYRGARYLRFSRGGVEVNQNSAMFYLNQTPVAQTPPTNLTRDTRPSWQKVTSGHAYGWHDGRLHALATVALAPGATYAGRWVIPLLLDGRPTTIAGDLWHAAPPSIVWFWPIAVLILCVLAAWRVRRPEVDAAAARACAIAALAAVAVAGIGRELYGRPSVGAFQLIELGVLLAVLGWLLYRVIRTRGGYFRYFVTAFVALWEGIELIPTLRDGFVLMAVPAFLARVATVFCLGCGVGLLLLAVRLAEQPDERRVGRTSAAALPGDDQDVIGNFA